MITPELIDLNLLDHVSGMARGSARLRKNHNFHASDSDCCHRLLNAMEPGSYVIPHRHVDPNKDETFVVLRGRFGLILFDTGGAITQKFVLDSVGPGIGITIPHGTFHSVVSLLPGSVFFESKAGPYAPLTPEELAAWAPAERDVGAAPYCSRLEALFA